MPFQLIGDRDYVQGSQMLASAAEMLPITAPTFILSSCAFRRVTDRVPVVTVIEHTGAIPTEALGEALFQSGGDVRRFMFSETDKAAQRAPENICWTLRENDAGEAPYQFGFAGADRLDTVLQIVIRAIKQRHADLAPDIRDIWFTSCRRANMTILPPASTGTLSIDMIRVLSRPPQHQTLSTVELIFDGGERQFAAIGFAFRSKEFVDGN